MRFVGFDENVEDLVRLHRQGLPPGSSTGWATMDEHYTVAPAQFTVVTGIPNHGKSEWLDAMLVNLLESPTADGKQWRFVVCSPENWPLELHKAKLLEKLVGRPFADGPRARITEEEIRYHAEKTIGRFFTFAEMDENETFPDLLNGLYEYCSVHNKDQIGIVLDPWNQLEHHRPANMSESEYISSALSAAIRITRKTGAHLWIVAHPTKLAREKDGTRPVPTPYDISGAAHWFNKADACITVWRDVSAVYGDPEFGKVHVYVQKIRFKHLGKVGEVILNYDRITGRYSQ